MASWYRQPSRTSNFIVQQNIKAKSGASGTKNIFNIYSWWYYKWKFKFDVISWCHLGLCDAYQNLYTIEILKHIANYYTEGKARGMTESSF